MGIPTNIIEVNFVCTFPILFMVMGLDRNKNETYGFVVVITQTWLVNDFGKKCQDIFGQTLPPLQFPGC